MKLSKGAKLIILGIVLVVIDQVVKFLVKTNMDLGQQIYVLGEWFRLCFVENEGFAFGMKFGGAVGKFALSLFRILLCGALIWWISSLCR
jgi:signal peptidase II